MDDMGDPASDSSLSPVLHKILRCGVRIACSGCSSQSMPQSALTTSTPPAPLIVRCQTITPAVPAVPTAVSFKALDDALNMPGDEPEAAAMVIVKVGHSLCASIGSLVFQYGHRHTPVMLDPKLRIHLDVPSSCEQLTHVLCCMSSDTEQSPAIASRMCAPVSNEEIQVHCPCVSPPHLMCVGRDHLDLPA